MTSKLAEILSHIRDALPELRARLSTLRAKAEQSEPPVPWDSAFGSTVSVIAEVKRRSPTAGCINEGLDPEVLASAYEAGGAGAISVLTNGRYFGGSLDDLTDVRRSTTIPVLRKDFIIDPVQVYEARAAGASAVLLIVRALDGDELSDLATLTRDLGMQALVEVHDHGELEAALRLEAVTIGVNSRDLDTFIVDVEAVRDVMRAIPAEIHAIAESGLARRADVERVAEWGADGVLVGTALAGSTDPALAVRQLTGVERHGRV